MADRNLKEAILELAGPAVLAQGLEIWGLELCESGHMTVRLFVERPKGEPEAGEEGDDASMALVSATVDQCEQISRQLSFALDAEDFIDRAYTLEVSSPGFSRLFFSAAQMAPYAGDVVEARMPSPWSPGEGTPARRTWRGILTGSDGESFTLRPATVSSDGDVREEDLPEVRVPFDQARRVSRIHIFRKPQKPGHGAKPGKAGKSGKGMK